MLGVDSRKVVPETAVVIDPDAIKAALKPYLGRLQSKGGPMDIPTPRRLFGIRDGSATARP
jgi:hypothetical protein